MLSQVIAKNIGDVFFETQCIYVCIFSTNMLKCLQFHQPPTETFIGSCSFMHGTPEI